MLRVAGQVDAAAASETAASIVDWRDPNDDVDVLTGGAEGSYYRALSEPYPCHNGDFQSLNELLLVKGISRELFWKIAPHLTLYGTGKVNLNAAGLTVLRILAGASGGVLPGGDESVARKIVRYREAGNTFQEADAQAIVNSLNKFDSLTAAESGMLLGSGLMTFVTIRSTYFGGIVEGISGMAVERTGASPAGARRLTRRADFVVNAKTGSIVYWHEH